MDIDSHGEDLKPALIKQELVLPTGEYNEDVKSCLIANVATCENSICSTLDTAHKIKVEQNGEALFKDVVLIKKEACVDEALEEALLSESDIDSSKCIQSKMPFTNVFDVEKKVQTTNSKATQSLELIEIERVKHESIDISGDELDIDENVGNLIHEPRRDLSANETGLENSDIDEELESADVKKILSEGNGVFYLCNACREELDSLKAFNVHAKTHENTRPTYTKFFTCALCVYTCKKALSINAHRVKTHVARRANQCDLCQYSSKHASALKNHKLIHAPFRCDLCDFSSKRASSITTHKLTHIGGKSFKCDSCDYTCMHVTAMKSHASTHKADARGTSSSERKKCHAK